MIAITPRTSQLCTVCSLMLRTLVVSLHLTTTPENRSKTSLPLKVLLFGLGKCALHPMTASTITLLRGKENSHLENEKATVLLVL